MCPKRQIISLYQDGELPSPWKEKMEAHLESCSECRAILSEYSRIGEQFRTIPKEVVLTAQERVWKKLTAPELVIPENQARQPGIKAWNRNVTLPLPVAAAAVLIIVASLAFVGVMGMTRPQAHDSIARMDSEPDFQESVPIRNMAEVLQYLSSQDTGDFMVIRLPESRTFSRIGEPTLINAADYSRRDIFR
jgi:anti-sigma factor RsiW